MFGAVAAGKAAGGYDSIMMLPEVMAHLKDEVYPPIRKTRAVYEKLYQEY